MCHHHHQLVTETITNPWHLKSQQMFSLFLLITPPHSFFSLKVHFRDQQLIASGAECTAQLTDSLGLEPQNKASSAGGCDGHHPAPCFMSPETGTLLFTRASPESVPAYTPGNWARWNSQGSSQMWWRQTHRERGRLELCPLCYFMYHITPMWFLKGSWLLRTTVKQKWEMMLGR